MNVKDIDLTSVGALLIDNIFLVDELPNSGFGALVRECGCFYGGRAPNVAIMLSSLGYQTCIVAPVGNDFGSSGYRKFLEDCKVHLDGLYVDDFRATDKSYVFTGLDQKQITFVQFEAFNSFKAMKTPDDLFARSKIVHFSSGDPDYNLKAAEIATKHGNTISFDVGNDVYMHTDRYLAWMLSNAHLVFMNVDESEYLKRRMRVAKITQLTDNDHLRVLVIIDKMRSVSLYSENGWTTFTLDVKRVKDRTGASDGFIAGFVAGYLRQFDLNQCLTLGNNMLNRVVQKLGCTTNLPTWNDLSSLRD
jgi:ribokinase